jgi:hypothetical protein
VRQPVKPTVRDLRRQFEQARARREREQAALLKMRQEIDEWTAMLADAQATLNQMEINYLEALAALPCHPVWLKTCKTHGRFFTVPEGRCPRCVQSKS